MIRRQRLRNTELSVGNNTYVEIPMSGVRCRGGQASALRAPKLIQIIKARRTPSHDNIANWIGRATDAELSRLFHE
jgi:hypothetical protein